MSEANKLFFCDACEKTFYATQQGICEHCGKPEKVVLVEELNQRPIPYSDAVTAALKELKEYQHTLKGLKTVYTKYLRIPDFRRLEVNWAVVLSARPDFAGEPLWLINVEPSAGMKTTIMDAMFRAEDSQSIIDLKNSTIKLNRMTSKALVSGQKGEYADLAPLLRNRCILIYDYSEILNLNHDEKIQVFAQWRELYDGNCGLITGMGTRKLYQGIHTAFIANSTPAIDHQLMQTNLLGTRELMCRGEASSASLRKEVSLAARDDESIGQRMSQELYNATTGFLRKREPYNESISSEVKEFIFEQEEYLAVMRATASIDQNGDLMDEPSVEGPGRLIKQFTRLYRCLKSLDSKYPDARAMSVINLVTESSCDKNRKRTLAAVIKHYEDCQKLTINPDGTKSYSVPTLDDAQNAQEVAAMLNVGVKTAKTQLNILHALGLLIRFSKKKETKYGADDFIFTSTFLANPENPIVKKKLKPDVLDTVLEEVEFGH